MRKAIVIACVSILVLITSNIYYYLDAYQWQINTQKDILLKQSLMVRDKLSQFAKETNTNISILISKKELNELFSDKGYSIDVQNRLKILYNGYHQHLEELRICDLTGNSFNLKQNGSGVFISTFTQIKVPSIQNAKVLINPYGTHITYLQPLEKEGELFGFAEFKMNLKDFFSSVFHNFNVKNAHYQWVLKPAGTVVYNSLNQKAFYPVLNGAQKKIGKKDWFYKVHKIKVNDDYIKVLTVFSKLYFNDVNYYLAFSTPSSIITSPIAHYSFVIGGISLFIITLIIVTFSFFIRRLKDDEKSLKDSEAALRKMVYYMPVGVLLIDSNNRIKQVNKAALKLFAFDDEDQLIGRIANDEILFENKIRLDKTTYSSYSNKYILINKDDEESVILHEQIPFYLFREKYTIQVFVEVSSLENERKTEEIAHRVKSTFIANISHELRTPLNGIIGITDILLTSEKVKEDQKLLNIVKRSADTLLALINDILDFSKIESGRFEIEAIPFDLYSEVESTVHAFKERAHEKGLELTWTTMMRLPEDYLGDQIRIRQILNNLISNAIKFTNRGRIHLSVKMARGINGSRAILFSLKDSGIGIRQEKLDSIFNPFSQEDESTTRKYGGTGLGITISKQLVEIMGGEIWVNSPSGISTDPECPGAEFAFTIPYKSHSHNKQFNYSHIESLSKVRSFIISDEPLQVRVLMKNLASLNIDYKVLPPSNESIDIIRTDNKHHLIIVDHRADFNGLDFLQDLYNHKLHKRLPIILQSSDFEPSNTSLAKRLGADVYMRKPVELKTLEAFILRFFPNVKQDLSAIENHKKQSDLKILVAEDNILNQRVAKTLFNKIGYNIDIASNGLEAVNKMKDIPYDLVFMDIMMPRMDGLEALKALKNEGFNCPVIAMTASVNESERTKVLNAGMDDFITKPTKVEELSRMIAKWSTPDE